MAPATARATGTSSIGAVATIYGLWLVYAAGLDYLLMCAILFAPGILVYCQGAGASTASRAFTGFESLIAVGIVAAGRARRLSASGPARSARCELGRD